jgi:hypothetical protein
MDHCRDQPLRMPHLHRGEIEFSAAAPDSRGNLNYISRKERKVKFIKYAKITRGLCEIPFAPFA